MTVLDVGGKPQREFWGKPTRSSRDWQPNPHSGPRGNSTGVPEVNGEQRPLRQPDRPDIQDKKWLQTPNKKNTKQNRLKSTKQD